MTEPTENWKPAVGYDGVYDVSDAGRVRRSPLSCPIGNVVPGKVLKPRMKSNGYLQVHLCSAGIKRSHTVHRLVAEAFFGVPAGRMDANHKNGIKTDNRLSNLEFITPAENMNHCVRTGLYPYGRRNGSRTSPSSRPRGEKMKTHKLTLQQVKSIREERTAGTTLTALAKKYGVAVSNIESITKFRTWRNAA